MGYIKVVKNKNYYKRYQVKFRRRRECKTNYKLRRRLIKQDKRKFNVPKWRLVARITNKDVIAQVVCAKVQGDHTIAAAYAHELKESFGLPVGLTNYASCYATGLLLARRLLTKLGMDKKYPGKKKLDGRRYLASLNGANWGPEDAKVFRPFKCILDVGLARTSAGARVFAVMKGAVDGGLHVPHSQSKFPGFSRNAQTKRCKYNADTHREKIFGGHVAKYMNRLKEEDPDKYARHFSQYIKNGIEPDALEDLYAEVHRNIRANPLPPKPDGAMDVKKPKKRPKTTPPMSKEEKNRRLAERIAARKVAAGVA